MLIRRICLLLPPSIFLTRRQLLLSYLHWVKMFNVVHVELYANICYIFIWDVFHTSTVFFKMLYVAYHMNAVVRWIYYWYNCLFVSIYWPPWMKFIALASVRSEQVESIFCMFSHYESSISHDANAMRKCGTCCWPVSLHPSVCPSHSCIVKISSHC